MLCVVPGTFVGRFQDLRIPDSSVRRKSIITPPTSVESISFLIQVDHIVVYLAEKENSLNRSLA